MCFSAEQGNLGNFIFTSIRVIWYAESNLQFNVSLPWVQIDNIKIRDSKFGQALVLVSRLVQLRRYPKIHVWNFYFYYFLIKNIDQVHRYLRFRVDILRTRFNYFSFLMLHDCNRVIFPTECPIHFFWEIYYEADFNGGIRI